MITLLTSFLHTRSFLRHSGSISAIAWVFGGLAAHVLLSCAPTIPVRISTPEPVKIDVRMQIDVVTKDDPLRVKQPSPEEVEAAVARRNRLAEVQSLKNDRRVGETNQGYLAARTRPTDEGYAAYVQRILEAENLDRSKQYDLASRQQGKPLPFIEREAAERWRANAYPGEWIQQDDGNWKAK